MVDSWWYYRDTEGGSKLPGIFLTRQCTKFIDGLWLPVGTMYDLSSWLPFPWITISTGPTTTATCCTDASSLTGVIWQHQLRFNLDEAAASVESCHPLCQRGVIRVCSRSHNNKALLAMETGFSLLVSGWLYSLGNASAVSNERRPGKLLGPP